MSNIQVIILLAFAALLEAGGDAIVRLGLHEQTLSRRTALIVLGGFVLTSYGVVVNAPAWDFGRLLGVYVALFFVAAQLINIFAFHVQPTTPVVLGGGLIVAGGLLMTFWR